jgi:hypothetical protein
MNRGQSDHESEPTHDTSTMHTKVDKSKNTEAKYS